MKQVHLLSSLPKIKRNITARAEGKTDEVIAASNEFGQLYFDGPRAYGYGGYRYDGRWKSVARDIIAHFGLKPGDRVLDVGCAKGFLVKDLLAEGIDAFGLDISKYALRHGEPETLGRLHLGDATFLPFPSDSFNAVISINTLHNLAGLELLMAIGEIERVAPGRGFVVVDAYHDEEQKRAFLDWVLTAKSHGYPQDWIGWFNEAGYTGDYDWTIAE